MKGAVKTLAIVGVCLSLAGWAIAQQTMPPATNCDGAMLKSQQEALAGLLPTDFEADMDKSLGYLYQLGTLYQQMAVDCGYTPTPEEVNALIQLTLSLTDLETILQATSVGDDVEAILAQLETVIGDPINGQLLYNGLENGLDGGALGCAGCHNGQTAPIAEGTWTRVSEQRLKEAQFTTYTTTQYLVESIVHPNAYASAPYQINLMPDNFSKRLDLQQLADIVAYLDSQDQLLDE